MTGNEKAIRWFESIADECDKLTSGNVAHLRAQIKGMAIRSAEYLKKHSQEPVSKKSNPLFDECVANVPDWVMKETSDKIDAMIAKEDLENEIARYEESICGFESSSRDDCIGIAKHFAEYGARMQKEQMMKGAVKGYIEGDQRNQKDEPYDVYAVSDSLDTTKFKIGDKVKVIIVKDND